VQLLRDTKVTVYLLEPLSGLANRLRSIASFLDIFSENEVLCFWGDDLLLANGKPPFTHPRLKFLTQDEYEDLSSWVNKSTSGLSIIGSKLYLWHPLGEQHFLPKTFRIIEKYNLELVYIRSGGEFGLASKARRESSRREIYSQFRWDPEIIRAHEKLGLPRDYVGLHIRLTDLAKYAPNHHQILSALRSVTLKLSLTSIFLATDTKDAEIMWRRTLDDFGFETFFQPRKDFGRKTYQDLVQASVDFLSLSNSNAMIFSEVSSFGKEASLSNSQHFYSRSLRPAKRLGNYYLNKIIDISQIRYLFE
jgi:hypothetical protein